MPGKRALPGMRGKWMIVKRCGKDIQMARGNAVTRSLAGQGRCVGVVPIGCGDMVGYGVGWSVLFGTTV